MTTKHNLILAVAAGFIAGTAGLQAVQARSVKDFYSGKDMTMYIGYSPGGGYDAYSRTLARHMGDHIPGHPAIIAKNLPGAGSMRLTNALYNRLPKDGTVIGMVGRGEPMEALFGNKGAHFDPTKFNWIGSVNNEVSTCVTWHTQGIDTVHKFLSRKIVVGGTGPGADTDVFPKVLNNVLGAHLDLVTGYPGGNNINVAMERGEVQGRCGWSWSSVKSTRPQWLKDHKININLQLSTSKSPELTKLGAPWVMDLAKTERDKRILTLIFARQAMGRPVTAPPDVPAARVAALRTAFDETMKDKGFLADVHKQKLELAPLGGKEVQDLVGRIMSTPPDVVEAAKVAANKTGNMYIKTITVKMVKQKGPVTKTVKHGHQIFIKYKGKVVKAKVSGSRTKVTINGKKSDRGKIKEGMTCRFTYPGPGSEAKRVDCRS